MVISAFSEGCDRTDLQEDALGDEFTLDIDEDIHQVKQQIQFILIYISAFQESEFVKRGERFF